MYRINNEGFGTMLNECLLDWYLNIPPKIFKRIYADENLPISDFVKLACPNFNTDSGYGSGECNCTGCWSKKAIDIKQFVDREILVMQNPCLIQFYTIYSMHMTETERTAF